ncbi:MAG: hypothetical protein OEW00_13900 [candidate division Zixibacteria bacterium]|nr:hypothetical protein [candidate division Zixibacteria bacterium]
MRNLITRILLAGLLLFLLSSVAPAQMADKAEMQSPATTSGLGLNPAKSPFSLLDLSRVRWSHSYSVSYFSGGGSSGSAGLFNSTLFYEFSPKLSLALNVGVLHNTAAIWGDGNSSPTILPGFRLDYHPSRQFQMSLVVQRMNSMYNLHGHYVPWNRRLLEPSGAF